MAEKVMDKSIIGLRVGFLSQSDEHILSLTNTKLATKDPIITKALRILKAESAVDGRKEGGEEPIAPAAEDGRKEGDDVPIALAAEDGRRKGDEVPIAPAADEVGKKDED